MLFGAAVGRAEALNAGALMIYAEPSAEGLYTRMGAIRIGEGTFYTNAHRSLRRALRLTRVTAAPDVVASRGDASKDGLRSDGCRDRPLHAELKLFAENPALRARAPRQSCTGLIEAHGKQFFIAALEEVSSLGIVRCISHGCLFDDVKERSMKHWSRATSSRKKIAARVVKPGARPPSPRDARENSRKNVF